MNRNPNHLTPRTMRDCTFCDWADPLERPEPDTPDIVYAYVALLVVAAIGLCIYRSI